MREADRMSVAEAEAILLPCLTLSFKQGKGER